MALKIKRPKGTQDILPDDIPKWRTVENLSAAVAEQFGFREIRTPVFEDTGLFVRSVGDTSDVVTKEMYTVSSKGNDTFTLRPEGTAGVVRAMIESGLIHEGAPQKVYYIIPCYRHERPQAGRLREFHTFGAEMFGSASPYADAEIILMAHTIFEQLGLSDFIELHINSIGCPECRAKYREALKAFFEPHRSELCPTCQERLDKNPLRLLDCKSPECREIAAGAPIMLDYLCEYCSDHFGQLKDILTDYGIRFTVDPKIVRGLDYYTNTVFEFISNEIGAQGTVCGGGRYDNLVDELSGFSIPALGFGFGLERLILTLENHGIEFEKAPTCDIYLASVGEDARRKCALLADRLRQNGFAAEFDLIGRGTKIKPQMKYADKIKAKYVCVIGSEELESLTAKIRDMSTGEETPIALDNFIDDFSEITDPDGGDMEPVSREELLSLLGIDPQSENKE